MKSTRLLHTFTTLVFLACACIAHAGSHTWSGAVSGFWSTDANWSAGGAPDVGEENVTLVFPVGATRYLSTNNIPGLEVKSITLAGDYTLGGSGGATLTMVDDAGIQVNGSHMSTIASSLPVVLQTNLLVYIGNAAGRLSIGSVISGVGGVAFAGDGTMVYSGLNPNTYEGITQVLEGELRLGKTGFPSKLAVPARLIIGTTNITKPTFVRLYDNHQIANDNVTVINASGTLELNGYVDSIGEINFHGGSITTDDGLDEGLLH